ncbi:hypothetical protein D3C71_1089100 [compost metagenome]
MATDRWLGQIFASDVAIDRHLHQTIERAHRCLGLLVAQGKPDDLAQRRGGATGEHHGSDQRTHGQITGVDQVDTDDDQRHGLDLLQERDRAGCHAGQFARLHRGVGSQCAEGFPASLHVSLTAGCLEGFQAFHGLDQHALLERGLSQVFLHGAGQRPLDCHADDQDQRNQQQRHPAQRTTHSENHTHEQQHEGQIGNGCQGCRGGEVTNGFEFAQLVGK